MSDDKFTIIFKGDIRKFRENPLTIASPFGEVFSVWVGDAYDEVEDLRAENEKLRAALKAVCQGVIKENEGLDWAVIDREALRAAAAALKETE